MGGGGGREISGWMDDTPNGFSLLFFGTHGQNAIAWLRVMMPFIRKRLKAAHFVSQFFVLISFFKNFEIFHHN